MIFDIVYILFLVFICVFFSLMLDYGLGHPGKKVDEFEGIGPSAKELLFGWSYFLAKSMLQITPKYVLLVNQFADKINSTDYETAVKARRQFRYQVFIMGREMFTWQYAFGMCIFCTNFWISLFFAGFFTFISRFYVFITFPRYFLFLCIPIFSHAILRLINKK
jgi:hypothetical protein